VLYSGPGSVVGIATGYGLDGPGIESRWRRDFPHQSRPALGPTSLLYNVYRVFLVGKERPAVLYSGPGSIVGIATGYGLDGPGIESRWGRDFPHQSRPALGPTSLLYNVYRVFLGGKERPGRVILWAG